MALISVIVSVYNVASHVAEAIASLRVQTFADFEALIVDDGSTDESGRVAAEAINGDPRFVLIRQDNAGLSGARNRGLDLAQGRYVAFLDGDDALAPRFLEILHDAIAREGTDWAACAISLVFPDGATITHPAIHGLSEPGPARLIAMTDARSVARLFPSAWNKLYRRSFLDGLRFPEGSWYEDHELFWGLAARGHPLSYCPEPLVLHRRDRPGQITGADSDRVFEQFTVLERLAATIQDSKLSHAKAGFAQLTTRLIHERALVLRQRTRRQRFLDAARAFLARHDCVFDPSFDHEISCGLALALRDQTAVSVVLLAGEGIGSALAALDRQSMADFDLTVIAPAQQALPEALPCGVRLRRLDPEGLTLTSLVEALDGRWVVLLGPDERLSPDGLLRLTNLIAHTKAPLALAGIERDGQHYHDGWSDNTVVSAELAHLDFRGGCIAMTPERALRLHPVLGNRIFDRELLAQLGVPVGGDALDAQALILDSALAADTIGYAAAPVVQVPDLPAPVPAPRTLAAQVKALALSHGERLPRGWRTVLYLRLARFWAASAPRGVWVWWRILGHLRRAGLPRMHDTWSDPETPLWVRMALHPRQTVERWRLHRKG